MLNAKKTSVLLLSLLLCLALLTGCGRQQVEVAGESYTEDVTELALVVTEEELGQLDAFDSLRSVDFSGSECYGALLAWAQAHPEVAVRYTVALPDGSVAENSAEALDLSAMDETQQQEALRLLPFLPQLRTVELGGQAQGETAAQLRESFPDVAFHYTPLWLGQPLDLSAVHLDLSAVGAEDARALLPWLPDMDALTSIDLGEGDGENSRIPWETVAAIEAARPDVRLDYRFSLYGKTVDLHDGELDLNHIRIYDQGALVKTVTACMPELRYLDMDFCGVDDAYMAEIRDALPEAEVVWRVWFGAGYTVRTDAVRILASNPGIGGQLTYENTRSLQYCTKVRYLDLGHNRKLNTIDFCAYMPELEVLVAAISAWTDASPLANCPNLEYAELQTCGLSDLRPLSGLQNLRHLNICHDFALSDISPLYGLENLERLWIGIYTPVPQEQIEEMQRRAPNCVINNTDIDPTRENWRWSGEYIDGYSIPHPRYELLRQQMEYDYADWAYCYIRNDPLYPPHGQGDNTTPPEWFTSQTAEYARGE